MDENTLKEDQRGSMNKIVHPKKSEGKKIVVIVGAGFAGLNAAKALAGNSELHIIVIDQKNHHLFQPLLYQVASAGLNPADIAVPIRSEFSGIDNVEIHLGRLENISLTSNTIQLGSNDNHLEFDYLILACGTMHSYFNHPEWEVFAPGLKTLEQATEIRRRMLLAFENAENEVDPEKQKALLNFVIVGGGPTGVELAGAIAEISRQVLVEDFHHIDPSSAQVTLIEAGPRVLGAFSEKMSVKTKKDLTKLGVNVLTSTRVQNIDEKGVYYADHFIPSQSVLWAAGVQAEKLKLDPAIETDRAGRIPVEPDLSIKGYPNVFVAGDMALVKITETQFVPGLAPAAIQEGKFVASQIKNDLKNKPRSKFKYLDKGIMATIGKNKAVLEFGNIKMSGYPAWIAWLFVHIFYLIGFKNRIAVMMLWAWSYMFSKRGARLITDKNWRLNKAD